MKAIWLRQPYPALIRTGVKVWETRSGPPNGPMRPKGVRGMPGLAIEQGERIAIVASKRRPVGMTIEGAHAKAMVEAVGIHDAPLGVVACTAVVDEVLPIEGVHTSLLGPYVESHERQLRRLQFNQAGFATKTEDISYQLPFGDWTPGRWAWRLTDIEDVGPGHAPVVTRGNPQGVCEIKETWKELGQ